MFNNMKNKIREKTGNDLPKFLANYNKIKSHHSRQSSISSISSVTSEQSLKDDTNHKVSPQTDTADSRSNSDENTNSNLRNMDGENNKTINDVDWEKKYYEKEHEWNGKEKIYVGDLLKQTKELQNALLLIEENQKKYKNCQEEKNQLESYQKQELMKIKQLLMEKEEENNTIKSTLKESSATIETLKQEINRLRMFEEQVNTCQDDLECLRHTSEKERWNLTSQMAQQEETIRHLQERVSVLTHRTEADCQALGAQLSADERVHSLLAERTLLERRLEEAHIHLSEIKTSWSNKIAILETQVGRLSRQAGEEGVERRRAETKVNELERKIDQVEKQKVTLEKQIEKLRRERDDLAQELKTVTAATHGGENTDEKLKEYDEKYDKLANEYRQLKERSTKLEQTHKQSEDTQETLLSEEREKNLELNIEMTQLRDSVNQMTNNFQEERNLKEQTIFRNAQISQQAQLADQELQRQRMQNEELCARISQLEQMLEQSQKVIAEQQHQCEQSSISSVEVELGEKLKEIEVEMSDKNKSIRMLQQKLIDMKKTLQEELKSNIDNSAKSNNSGKVSEEDINYKYLKHVLVKFLTSSEHEAQHLTRVVASLLQLNTDEERLLRDTLEWRMSWFGMRPKLKHRLQHS